MGQPEARTLGSGQLKLVQSAASTWRFSSKALTLSAALMEQSAKRWRQILAKGHPSIVEAPSKTCSITGSSSSGRSSSSAKWGHPAQTCKAHLVLLKLAPPPWPLWHCPKTEEECRRLTSTQTDGFICMKRFNTYVHVV